ncbi:MAG TPA: ATP-binding protein [Planctomycetaceae bacterium]|nr:ATP-binding protein [Planctomycetaceae bacterium]
MSAAAVLGGAFALAGWTIGSDVLKSLVPGLVAMNPATAVLFVLAGSSLWLLRVECPAPAGARTGAALAALVAFGGTWQLMSDLCGWSIRFDGLLFAPSLGGNRMAPNTALHFLLTGSGLLLVDRSTRRGLPPAQVSALLMLAGSALALVGYLFGAQPLYGVPSFIPMALNTAALFALLAVGLLAARPGRGVMVLLTASGAGGLMVRRLVPVALILPPILGGLQLAGQQAGLYGTEFGTSLFVAASMAVFLAAIWWTGRAIDQADRARQRAEEELRQAHDALERRVQERTAELLTANSELDQKNRENEMFVYSVSHDLRSPLVNLQGFSRELELACRDLRELISGLECSPALRAQATPLIDENIGEAIRFIQSGVLRLSGIIDSLLRLSRAGRVEYRMEHLEVSDIVSRVIESLSLTISDGGVQVQVRELPPAYGDASAVEQVFANLIGNALKYLDPGRPGEIEIGAATPDGQGQSAYYVRDNGLGIDSVYHAKIFQAFQRVHPEAAPGDGMGLAIVRRVVERHGGHVRVESTAGAGSTFFVALPGPPARNATPRDSLSRDLERQEQFVWQPNR